MGIGHTRHLQLHTLSEDKKGQLIYDSEFSEAGEAVGQFPFLSFEALIQCPQTVYTHSRRVCISDECLKL